MLRLVEDASEIEHAQDDLKRAIKTALDNQGPRNIGFPSGNFYQTVYASGEGMLWAAFGVLREHSKVPRFWNAFGVYRPDRPAQMITVEINIPTDSNSARVGGFFAEDTDTGDIYLMHRGKVGGGRKGIGKSAFLVWSKAKLVEVSGAEGAVQKGIAVGRIGDDNLVERIRAFVRSVQDFKDKAAAGETKTPYFEQRIKEFYKYRKEFSGKKKGTRSSLFEYVTYHGDIVQAIYEERSTRAAQDEGIFNSNLIDLFVKKAGVVSEIYEVKTGVGRQALYTAIGQLVTHSAAVGGEVTQYLVIPADETIAQDLEQAMAVLRIEVRRFKLIDKGRRQGCSVRLDWPGKPGRGGGLRR